MTNEGSALELLGERSAGRCFAADPSRDPRLVYLASLGQGSRRTMTGALKLLARELGAPSAGDVAWWLLRFQHVAALRARLAAKHSGNYTNKILAALRGTLKNCARLGLMTREDLAGALDVQSVRSVRVLRGRSLGSGEVLALFRACADGTRQGARDAAILALLYGCGLRRSEVAILDLADLSDDAILVRGKGNKERRVYLPAGARSALAYWLRARGKLDGPLILPGDTRGLRGMRRCSDEVIRSAVERRSQLAGVRHCTPHDMRYSFTGDLLDGARISSPCRGCLATPR